MLCLLDASRAVTAAVVACILTTVAGCALARPVSQPDPGLSPAFGLERDLERLAQAHTGADVLWPGFDPLAVPLAVYDGHQTFLFRHPSPPEGFVAVPGASPAAAFPGRYDAMSANSSAEIGGVQTATVLLDRRAPLYAERLAAGFAPLAVHEAFHVFQLARHPGWTGNEADLFVYPAGDAALLARRQLETEALRRALGAADAGLAACWSRRALQVRRDRFARLDSASVAYERGTELKEGLAAYVEGRAAGRPVSGVLDREFGPGDVRLRAYATGPALAILLDRFAPGWPASFEADDRQALDGALGEALADADGEPCVFTPEETAQAERQARTDVAAYRATLEERVRAFEAKPGWRVVVEAAAVPLWPQGFDPLNVSRVGPARILHTRLLQLGNGSGQLKVLDADGADVGALTDGAGAHPLFSGVARVEVTGLAEPVVTETEDTVSVCAPGFTAAFRGATVVRGDRLLTIRLTL